jgi:hypothetical protein
LKIIVIANALLVTAAFIGCPARNDQGIMPIPIAPPPIVPPKDPPPPPFVTIAPYGGNVPFFPQNPPSPNQDSKNDKRGPNQ